MPSKILPLARGFVGTEPEPAIQSSVSGLPALPFKIMPTPCKHPQVRVVSRQDDAEFVECQDCGEVFDSEEFRDMEIEEKTGLAADQPDPGLEAE